MVTFVVVKRTSWSAHCVNDLNGFNVFLIQPDQHGGSVFVAQPNTDYKS